MTPGSRRKSVGANLVALSYLQGEGASGAPGANAGGVRGPGVPLHAPLRANRAASPRPGWQLVRFCLHMRSRHYGSDMHDRDVVAAIVAGDPAGLAEAYDRY